jgi:AAA domain
MLSGDPGAGKTYLALAFAAALTVGKIPYTGDPVAPLNVVYLSTENSPEFVLRARFDALQGDANRFHLLQGAVTGDGSKQRRESARLSDIPLLEEAVKQTKARLLVVDPIQSYLGGEVDMHRSNETRPILDGLAMLAQRHKVCILILRHFAKATTGSAINRGLGSIDLTGAARSELHAGFRDQQRAMVHAKTNIGELGKSLGYDIRKNGSAAGEFLWTGETAITANDLAAGGMADEERDAVRDAVESLTEMLRGGPRLASDIMSEMREIGVSPATLRRAKMKLGVKSRKRSGARDGHFEWVLEGYEDGQIAAS